jgi:hypothetical protein
MRFLNHKNVGEELTKYISFSYTADIWIEQNVTTLNLCHWLISLWRQIFVHLHDLAANLDNECSSILISLYAIHHFIVTIQVWLAKIPPVHPLILPLLIRWVHPFAGVARLKRAKSRKIIIIAGASARECASPLIKASADESAFFSAHSVRRLINGWFMHFCICKHALFLPYAARTLSRHNWWRSPKEFVPHATKTKCFWRGTCHTIG